MRGDHLVDAGHHRPCGKTARYLLVYNYHVRPPSRLVNYVPKTVQGALWECSPRAEIEPALLLSADVRLGVDKRLPIGAQAEHAGSARPELGQQLHQGPAERILTIQTDRPHLPHPEGNEVGDHVARATGAIALVDDAMDR